MENLLLRHLHVDVMSQTQTLLNGEGLLEHTVMLRSAKFFVDALGNERL